MHRKIIGIYGNFDEGMQTERNARSMVVGYAQLTYDAEIMAMHTRNSCKHKYMWM